MIALGVEILYEREREGGFFWLWNEWKEEEMRTGASITQAVDVAKVFYSILS